MYDISSLRVKVRSTETQVKELYCGAHTAAQRKERCSEK